MPEEVKFDIDAARALADDRIPCMWENGVPVKWVYRESHREELRVQLRAACDEIKKRDKRIAGEMRLADAAIEEMKTQANARSTLAAEVARLTEALVDIDKFEPTNLPEVDPYQVIAVYNKRRARAALAPLDAKVAK